jgi:hypothetical protein
MNKAFLIITLFSSIIIYSQDTPGNLQFNRVVNFSEVITVNRNSSSIGTQPNRYAILTPVSIPDGKVLKITNLVVAGYYETGNIKEIEECSSCGASIGGITVFTHETAGYTTNNKIFPLWFNSGEKEFLVFNENGGKMIVSFTGIEFNIVN